MPTTYNILPLALGTDYHVLARTGLLIPPLRERTDPGATVPVATWADVAPAPARSISQSAPMAASAWNTLAPSYDILGDAAVDVPLTVWAHISHAPTVVDNPPVASSVPATAWAASAFAPSFAVAPNPALVPPAAYAYTALAPSIYISAPPAQPPLFVSAWTIPGPPALDITAQVHPIPAPTETLSASWAWAVVPGRPKAEIHICTLDDLELPITSWQARIRDGSPTYLSVVTGYEYVDAITARQGGSLQIFKGHRYLDAAGGRRLVLLINAAHHTMRYDRGARSASVTLVGYVTTTHATPKTVNLPDSRITFQGLQADGRRRLRTGVFIFGDEDFQDGDAWDFAIRPGDTVQFGPAGLDSLIVGHVSISVSPTQEIMELVEQ